MFLYIIIFLSKVIENAVATLRLIVVSNGKKFLGAILQGIVAIVWICVTGIVVKDILQDPFKIVAFALGSIVGSYLGSFLEEKIALGNQLLTIIVDKSFEQAITQELRNWGFAVTSTLGKGKDREKAILFIFLARKKTRILVNLVKKLDSNALILSETACHICGGYHTPK